MRKKVFIGAVCIVLLVLFLAAGNVAYRFHLLQAMNPEGHYFDAGGVRLHYNVAGNGCPIILVHGLAVNGGINFWARGVIDRLAEDYKVITLDNRGHGRSEKLYDPEQYGIEMCRDIIRLMDYLEIEKAHVLGYSMGGFIVLKMASLYPERLLSFVPCGSGWTADPASDLHFFEELADDLERGKGYGMLSDRLTPIGRKVRRRNRFFMSVGLSLINDNRAIVAFLRSTPALEVPEAALRANETPALAVVGDRDPLRPLAEEMAAVTANMELLVTPDADHLSTMRRPAALEGIEAFLKKHTPESLTMNVETIEETAGAALEAGRMAGVSSHLAGVHLPWSLGFTEAAD